MIQNPEALLVLGCGIDENGQLVDDSRSSAQIAAEMWSKGEIPLVIMSGSVSYKANFTPPISEAQAMKDCVVSLGVPSASVLTEAESKDTLGNVVFTRLNILDPLEMSRVMILPGPNHSKERLEFLFRKVFADKIAYSFVKRGVERPQEQEREGRSLKVLRHWLDDIDDGDVVAIYQLLRERHPGYSSDPKAWDRLKVELESA